MKAEMPAHEMERLHTFFDHVSDTVERQLDVLLPQSSMADESQLFEAMRYSVFAGGKRLRPGLILAVNSLLGGREESALRVAAAMECVHTYSLIHDDLPCMDDDDLRRGKPTCHVKFGECTAVLAGDALLTFAFEILSSAATHKSADVRCDLVAILAKAAGPEGMVGGQMIDMLSEKEEVQQHFDQGALARLQRKKTGALFVACCEAAMILNGRVTAEERQRLVQYASNLGLAFQMVDDVLDEVGDRDTLGKSVGKDRDAGKPTFATILGVDGARSQAQLLCQQAQEALSIFKNREEAEVLKLLARFVVKRAH